MANNAILFNAALAGVFGGINTSRSILSADAADYAAQTANALAFATLLDGQIAAGTYGQQDADLLGSIVQQVVSGKGSAGPNLATINAIIAAFVTARADLQPQVVASGTPLTRALFVDPFTTTPLTQQNGSAISPFATIQQAVDAMPTSGGTVGGTILLSPGVYPAEAVVADSLPFNFVGLSNDNSSDDAACDLSAVTITSNESVVASGITLGSILALAPSGAFVHLTSCQVNTIGCSNLVVTEGSIVGVCDSANDMSFIDSRLNGDATIAGNGTIKFQNSTFTTGPGPVVGGDVNSVVQFDASSYQRFLEAGGSFNANIRPNLINLPIPKGAQHTDGSAPISVTLLPAGHPPGVYLWTLYFQKTVAATAGNLVAQANYTDDGGPAVLLRPNASLTGTGHFNLSSFPIYSTGVDPVTVDMTFPGIAGAGVDMNLYNVLTPLSQNFQ